MLLFSLSEEFNPDEGTGTSIVGTRAVGGGMGIGMGDSPLGKDIPDLTPPEVPHRTCQIADRYLRHIERLALRSQSCAKLG